MAQNLILKLDVKKIEKERLFTGEKGTYLDAVIVLKDEVDQYGNIGMVIQSVSKEEREKGIKGAILGNVKYLQRAAAPLAPADLVLPDAGNLPF